MTETDKIQQHIYVVDTRNKLMLRREKINGKFY